MPFSAKCGINQQNVNTELELRRLCFEQRRFGRLDLGPPLKIPGHVTNTKTNRAHPPGHATSCELASAGVANRGPSSEPASCEDLVDFISLHIVVPHSSNWVED
jgi:hypothetical protein